jgi:hypothetical protein
MQDSDELARHFRKLLSYAKATVRRQKEYAGRVVEPGENDGAGYHPPQLIEART